MMDFQNPDTSLLNGKKLFIDRNEELLCLTHQHKALAIVYKDHEENVYRIKRGLWG